MLKCHVWERIPQYVNVIEVINSFLSICYFIFFHDNFPVIRFIYTL